MMILGARGRQFREHRPQDEESLAADRKAIFEKEFARLFISLQASCYPASLPQDSTGFLLSTMSNLGSSLGIETKSDVYPQSELIETYPYSHP